jgi:hypothetical protein
LTDKSGKELPVVSFDARKLVATAVPQAYATQTEDFMWTKVTVNFIMEIGYEKLERKIRIKSVLIVVLLLS